jgi:hypothetical protein
MSLKNTILILVLVIANSALAQNAIKMTNNYGSNNTEIQDLIDFQNIYIEKLNFEGKELINKSYEINIQEFKKGKLIKKANLFDGNEDEYFKIKSDTESLKFFFSLTDGKLKTYIRGKKFGSKKSYFNIKGESDQYALKDFFGDKEVLNMPVNEEFPVFAIITPSINKDGSGSYCKVVQSDIKPEKLGEHFKIPHYFLITMKFK